MIPAGCVVVLAAHAGAGASTVALAVSDVAAAADRRVHLVETAHPARSGLVAAASVELGSDATGGWRRGRRGRITIDRRAADTEPRGRPTPPDGEGPVVSGPVVSVIDIGLPAPADLPRLATARSRTVVVCRATLPGMRLTEQVLNRLNAALVVVAAVGPPRWPGEVIASLGPRLLELRAAGRVVPVPVDGRLQIAGLTGASLPKPVLAAGRALWALLDADRPEAAPDRGAGASNATGSRR